MNYGETLAEWYLRLNGFFLVQNLVVHQHGGGPKHNADIDLLALRMPFVFEQTGGRADDWDSVGLHGLIPHDLPVGVIAEVKTSATARCRPTRLRLKYGIERMGTFPQASSADIARHLSPPRLDGGNPLEQRTPYQDERGVVATLLVCPEIVAERHRGQFTHVVTLEWINLFIRRRMRTYAQAKHGARLFFPNDLIQYFAAQAGIPQHDD
ncbi:hypothetical protein [Deinococcus enclensis]|uniref:Restriction endonuclease n=1 Tax=Deinococcus enclensis TaxID=1049582 RepID=A0ABT9MJH4_9DEIO|nr:hypothetical protein [Deinococcus enclensis]MDP9766364.1 hypothetical protein [Deinococcus enclensis]